MKVLLVSIIEGKENPLLHQVAMEELEDLTKTAGYEIVDRVIVPIRAIDPKTYIGKGKLEELVHFYDTPHLDGIIIQQEISASQIRAIEEKNPLRGDHPNRIDLQDFCAPCQDQDCENAGRTCPAQLSSPSSCGERGGDVTNPWWNRDAWSW